jgi:hypothetical protein
MERLNLINAKRVKSAYTYKDTKDKLGKLYDF